MLRRSSSQAATAVARGHTSSSRPISKSRAVMSVDNDRKKGGRKRKASTTASNAPPDGDSQAATTTAIILADAGPSVRTAKSSWEPPNWRQQLDNIETMRGCGDAPVDTMGCSELADKNAEPKLQRFQVLLSLLLSSQTKDQVNAAAMDRLKNAGCSVDQMLQYSEEEIEKMIIPVSFYKRKAIYIKKTAAILREQYDSDVPNNVDELCALPGVGPKMAHLVMLIAWDKVTGIPVDTHVHRISNRLDWVQRPTVEPEATRKALEDWLPREEWKRVNKLFVGFGQQTCTPLRPKCAGCLNQKICPIGRKHKSD